MPTLTAGPIIRLSPIDGEDGTSAVAPEAPIVQIVYRRAATKPSSAAGTYSGTTYTPATGWTTAIPNGSAKLWQQFIIINPNTDTTRSEGVVQAEGQDGADGTSPKAPLVQVVYRRSSTKPASAAGTYAGTTYTPAAGWSTSIPNGTVKLWQQWIIIDPNDNSVRSEGVVQSEGLDGSTPSAPQVLVVYRRLAAKPSSAAGTYSGGTYTPASNWTEAIPNGTVKLWQQFIVIDPNDGSVTSEGVVQSEGVDGVSPAAPVVRVVYRRSTTKPSSAAGTYSGGTYTPAANWTEAIPSGSSTLWQQWIIIDPNDNSVTSEGVVQAEGQDGVPGADGTDGVSKQVTLLYEDTAAQFGAGEFWLSTTLDPPLLIMAPNALDRPYLLGVPVGARLKLAVGGTIHTWDITARASNVTRGSITNAISWDLAVVSGGSPTLADGTSYALTLNYVEGGTGIEYVFAAHSGPTTNTNQRPVNSWGYDSRPAAGTVRNGVTWLDGAPSLTAAKPYLLRSERRVPGSTLVGGAVTDSWTTPAVVGRFGPSGAAGAPGADAVGRTITLRHNGFGLNDGQFFVQVGTNVTFIFIRGANVADRDYIGTVGVGARVFLTHNSARQSWDVTGATNTQLSGRDARRLTVTRVVGSATPTQGANYAVSFSTAVRGTDGTDGTDGTNGIDGVDGNDGNPGARGLPGTDGNDVDTRLVMRRAATKPSISGGSWTSPTFSTFSAPTGWSETVPDTPANQPLWAAFAIMKEGTATIRYTAVTRFSVDPADIPNAGINAATKLALNSITDTVIADDAIRTRHVLAQAITASQIAAETITATEIAAGTLQASHMAAGTLSAGNITAGTMSALIRMLSPDIVAQDANDVRRFIRLFAGTMRFGDDGRIGAEIDEEIADADYILVGKFQSGQTLDAPAWTEQNAPANVNTVTSGIPLGETRRYGTFTSGAPSNRAGVYARSAPRQMLAVDSNGNGFIGTVSGVGTLTLAPATSHKLPRGVITMFDLGGVEHFIRVKTINTGFGSSRTVDTAYRTDLDDLAIQTEINRVGDTSDGRNSFRLRRVADTFDDGQGNTQGVTHQAVTKWQGALVQLSRLVTNTYSSDEYYDEEDMQTYVDEYYSVIVEAIGRISGPVSGLTTSQTLDLNAIQAGGASIRHETDGSTSEGSWALTSGNGRWIERIATAWPDPDDGEERLLTVGNGGQIWLSQRNVTPTTLTFAAMRGERRGFLRPTIEVRSGDTNWHLSDPGGAGTLRKMWTSFDPREMREIDDIWVNGDDGDFNARNVQIYRRGRSIFSLVGSATRVSSSGAAWDGTTFTPPTNWSLTDPGGAGTLYTAYVAYAELPSTSSRLTGTTGWWLGSTRIFEDGSPELLPLHLVPAYSRTRNGSAPMTITVHEAAAAIDMVAIGTDLLLLMRDGRVFHVHPGASGVADFLSPTLLGTVPDLSGSDRPRQIEIINGTPWILKDDGAIICVELAGTSATWRGASLENRHPNVAWNSQRDNQWRLLATQASGSYPGDATSEPDAGDALMVHTAFDGDQQMYYYQGSARAWTRGGEGSHEGAPIRLVPRGSVVRIPQNVPDNAGSRARPLYLRQAADGTLSWSSQANSDAT